MPFSSTHGTALLAHSSHCGYGPLEPLKTGPRSVHGPLALGAVITSTGEPCAHELFAAGCVPQPWWYVRNSPVLGS